MIKLRFVTHDDPLSAMIRFQAGICMPFTPSHCEAVSQDGKSYIGQHVDGGMKARPVGYDAATMLHELFVNLPCTPEQEAAFYAAVKLRIGAAYDWESILSFIDPAWNLHEQMHLICSAEMTADLRTKGCEYFQWPLVVPFHHVSPRDLLLILSGRVEIDH
jgi:hypothetical protein